MYKIHACIELAWSSCELHKTVTNTFAEAFREGGSVKGSNWHPEAAGSWSKLFFAKLSLLFHWLSCAMLAFLLHQLVILKHHHYKEPAGLFLLCHMLMWATKTQGTSIAKYPDTYQGIRSCSCMWCSSRHLNLWYKGVISKNCIVWKAGFQPFSCSSCHCPVCCNRPNVLEHISVF